MTPKISLNEVAGASHAACIDDGVAVVADGKVTLAFLSAAQHEQYPEADIIKAFETAIEKNGVDVEKAFSRKEQQAVSRTAQRILDHACIYA